jgi:hypothetical protein
MQMTEPLSRNNRVAGSLKAAVTKGQEELCRAGLEAAWTKANCTKGSRDLAWAPASSTLARYHAHDSCLNGTAQVPYSGMETYRIVPYRRTYRVEAISADGAHRVLDVWSTEEAAVSCLRTLQIRAERADRRSNLFAKDWRG